jgi:hypothetical protein
MIAICCALMRACAVLLFALWGTALPGTAAAGGMATVASPARVSVQIPPAAMRTGIVMLELGITSSGSKGGVQSFGAVVRLQASDTPTIEIGRLSFTSDGGGEQSYQFNIADALKRLGSAGGSAEVEVAVINRGGGQVPSGATLSIGHARIITR